MFGAALRGGGGDGVSSFLWMAMRQQKKYILAFAPDRAPETLVISQVIRTLGASFVLRR